MSSVVENKSRIPTFFPAYVASSETVENLIKQLIKGQYCDESLTASALFAFTKHEDNVKPPAAFSALDADRTD